MTVHREVEEGVGGNGNHSYTNGNNGSSNGFPIYDTTRIGDQGEFYLRSLYGLMKHPNGELRPDLISVNGSFTPKLAMEVKTFLESRGRARLTPWGLTYGFNSNTDFVSVFGDCLPEQNPSNELVRMERNQYGDIPNSAFYYNLMQRKEPHPDAGKLGHFADLDIKFGDQMIIPHDLAFYSFVIGVMRGKKIEFDRAFGHVRDIVSKFLKNGYIYTGHDKHDHQDLHYNDYLSLFMDEPSLLRTDEAKERVDLLNKFYGDDRIANLKRMTYVGPNNTWIHAFYREDHETLFKEQIKERIAQRRDVLTHLTKQREKEVESLAKLEYVPSDTLILEEGKKRMNPEDEARLARLLEWKLSKDHGPEFTGKHPHAIEPEVTAGTQRALF